MCVYVSLLTTDSYCLAHDRPARDTYPDPKYRPVSEADEIDLLEKYTGRMSELVPEGTELLALMLKVRRTASVDLDMYIRLIS